ncbi:TM2 domain protein [Carpediemonas membranifera]|uniref:TM2 domain protein n=1 Tax=Carpediemonas membranifera TaxID=201153 RepID=A0A8J6E0E6_9EUKA|nr:TM2 domain protein [Carpediemonas membranifera]|eukprot:KAG9391736.1 TM2 domain protein [Carpediemonas membranifera]
MGRVGSTQTQVSHSTLLSLQRNHVFTALRDDSLAVTVVSDGRAAWGTTKSGRFCTGYAYCLLLLGFVGIAGLHRLYVGRVRSALLYLFTFGFLGIGTAIDLALLWHYVRVANYELVILDNVPRNLQYVHPRRRGDGVTVATSPGKPMPRVISGLTPEFHPSDANTPVAMSAGLDKA